MERFITHSGRYTFSAVSQSVSRARHAVTGFAQAHGVPGEVLDNIALAVSEACTNVVLHAYRDRSGPGGLSLYLELEARSLRIHVRDEGMGMGPRPDSPGLGLGLPIIARVANGFAVEPGPRGGTELCMRFDLDAPPLAAVRPLVA
jgi:serine/threonine-protein kinase RsbW